MQSLDDDWLADVVLLLGYCQPSSDLCKVLASLCDSDN
jgi:hypothetical protein